MNHILLNRMGIESMHENSAANHSGGGHFRGQVADDAFENIGDIYDITKAGTYIFDYSDGYNPKTNIRINDDLIKPVIGTVIDIYVLDPRKVEDQRTAAGQSVLGARLALYHNPNSNSTLPIILNSREFSGDGQDVLGPATESMDIHPGVSNHIRMVAGMSKYNGTAVLEPNARLVWYAFGY